MATFPNGKYDDQVDSTSQALDWSKNGAPVYGVLEYYRSEAAKLGLGFPCPLPAVPVETARASQSSDQAIPSTKFNPLAPDPCPQCAATCVGLCSGQLRCNQCGHAWWRNGKAPEVARFSRAEANAANTLNRRYLHNYRFRH